MNKYLKTALLVLCAMALIVGGTNAVKHKTGSGGWLGVYMQSVNYELAEAFDLSVNYGVIINQIMDDSPAEEAGLKDEDIIVGLDDHKITGSDDLIELLSEFSEGDEITLTVIRGDDKKKIKVKLTENLDYQFESLDSPRFPKAFRTQRSLRIPQVPRVPRAPRMNEFFNEFTFDFGSSTYLGVSLSSLSDQLGDYFGIKNGEGALVTEVEEDSPAENAGIKAGDIIVGVDGDDVDDYDDIQNAIRKKNPGDKVTVNIIRNHKKIELTVEVGERDEHGYNYYFGDGSDIDIAIPNFNRIFKSHIGNADVTYEVEKHKKEMEELRYDLEKMKKELQEIRKKLD